MVKNKEDSSVSKEDIEELADICMISNSKMGRPKIWDEEAINKFADDMLEWAKKDTSLVLCAFSNSKLYDTAIFTKLSRMSPYFHRALYITKRILGERRETGTITKDFSTVVYERTQRMYDPDYDAYRYAELEKEERIKAEAKIKVLTVENELLKKAQEAIQKLEKDD